MPVRFEEKELFFMKHNTVYKLALAGILVAVAVAGSLISFPFLGSKCAPIQHMVNIICAVFLGPWYGVAVAFVASLLRNLFSLGTPMAFPGSMCGALLCGLVYAKLPRLLPTCLAEVFGTGVLGGLAAYPVAVYVMGQSAAVYAFIVPFLISTGVGSLIAWIALSAMKQAGMLSRLQPHL